MINWFIEETYNDDEDRELYIKTVDGVTDVMEVCKPFKCGDGFIPVGFRFNGASSGILRNMPLLGFPKWKHPKATCRHDWRCEHAESPKERKLSDKLFFKGVGIRGTKWEQLKGYMGVRVGAFIGIGAKYNTIFTGAISKWKKSTKDLRNKLGD